MRIRAALSRRQLLREIGLGGVASLALPSLPLLEGDAQAAGTAPRRLFMIIHGNGTNQPTNSYFPKAPNLDLSTSTILAPIKDLQSKIVVLEGLRHTLFRDGATGGSIGRPHVRSMKQVLTGMPLMDQSAKDPKMVGGISVDQVIANTLEQQLKSAGQRSPPFKVVGSAVGDYIASLQSLGPGQLIPPTVDPQVQYDRLFAGLEPPSAGDSQAAEAARRLRQEERGAIFDFVGRRLQGIGNIVGTHDKLKIEAHFDHLSALRGRLAQLATPIAGCPTGAITAEGPNAYAKALDAHGQIIARAFACDLTRVALLAVFDFPGSIVGVKENEHAIAHNGSNTPGFAKLHVQLETWRMGVFGGILRHFDSIREGDGTLLDNTLLVVTSDMGGGSHQNDRVPTFIAGSGGGALKTNRHLRLSGVPWNNFLVSLCQLMGVPMEKFGAPSICTGAVPGLA